MQVSSTSSAGSSRRSRPSQQHGTIKEVLVQTLVLIVTDSGGAVAPATPWSTVDLLNGSSWFLIGLYCS